MFPLILMQTILLYIEKNQSMLELSFFVLFDSLLNDQWEKSLKGTKTDKTSSGILGYIANNEVLLLKTNRFIWLSLLPYKTSTLFGLFCFSKLELQVTENDARQLRKKVMGLFKK